jgi:hypothetical protein
MLFSQKLLRSPQTASSWIIIGLGVLPGLLFQAVAADLASAGPLFDKFDLTLALGHRTEAAGPFFYSELQETQHTWAFPPFFAQVQDPATESEEIDVLYPLLSYDRFGDQYRWHVFQLLSYASGPTQTEATRNRFTLFPLYFRQRSSDPNENY